MPKLWKETIEAHRQEVRDAILDTAATLVSEKGLRSVTMAQIAGATGVGRATLYKYFSGVEAILEAWHQRHVTRHLDHLGAIQREARPARDRLEEVLETYALIGYEHHGNELAALVHQGEHVARARQHLKKLVQDLLTEAAMNGVVRDDVAAEELAGYCLHALGAADNLPSKAAVHRLVAVILTGLEPRG